MEPVAGVCEAVEILSNTGQALSTIIKDDDVPSKSTSEVKPLNGESTSVDATIPSSPSAHCDLNSNFQQHAKTKGTLRRQLHKKRQQLITGNVAVPGVEKSTDNSEKKKSLSSNSAASQVCSLLCLVELNTGVVNKFSPSNTY